MEFGTPNITGWLRSIVTPLWTQSQYYYYIILIPWASLAGSPAIRVTRIQFGSGIQQHFIKWLCWHGMAGRALNCGRGLIAPNQSLCSRAIKGGIAGLPQQTSWTSSIGRGGGLCHYWLVYVGVYNIAWGKKELNLTASGPANNNVPSTGSVRLPASLSIHQWS